MISSIVSRLVILLFGTLYPAYASYKAVRTKDVREYVKWMMYWIVFALFTCAETFTDVLLSFWFPFYYEIKIIVVVWLLSPATKGSSILYRKFVHPTLKKREQEIDEAISNAKAQGYSTILKLGARSVDYAKYVIMQTAIKGLQSTSQLQPVQSLLTEAPSRTVTDGESSVGNMYGRGTKFTNGYMEPRGVDPFETFQYSDDDDLDYVPQTVMKEEVMEPDNDPIEEKVVRARPKRRSARSRKQGGGGLMNQLRKSYSLSDLTENPEELRYRAKDLGSLQEEQDVVDHGTDLQYLRRSLMHPGQRSGSVPSPLDMYFSEVNLDSKQRRRSERQHAMGLPLSMEDVSSGYSSADPLFNASLGNSPTADHILEDVFLRSLPNNSIESKLRKSVHSGNMTSKKSSEDIASLVDHSSIKLGAPQNERLRVPILPDSFFLELKNSLLSGKSDIGKLLASHSHSNYLPEVDNKIEGRIYSPTNVKDASLKDRKPITTTNVLFSMHRNPGEGSKSPLVENKLSDVPLIIQGRSTNAFGTSSVTSDNTQEPKGQTARAGRYRKLRAPGPPDRTSYDVESMSHSEHGSVLNARMSLVSSRKFSGSVDILVESDAGSCVLDNEGERSKKSNSVRRAELHYFPVLSSLLRSNCHGLSNSSSQPKLDSLSLRAGSQLGELNKRHFTANK